MNTNNLPDYKNWRLEVDSDNILWLYFDKYQSPINTMNHAVMEELASIIQLLTIDSPYKGAIIASAKKTGFIAGADVNLFTQIKEKQEIVAILTQGQHIFQQLESLPLPVVAMIDGFCLGGGLELALACHYRVAEDSPKTRLGLPEVKLGIHPGWGGSVRLPRYIGVLPGLNMILSGQTVTAKTAAKLGFVEAAVPKRHLERAAKSYLLKKPPRREQPLLNTLINQPIARRLLSKFLRKKLQAKVNPAHYPAPFVVVDNWEQVGLEGHTPFEREAESCAKLFLTPTCKNLVRVFFLQERLKSLGKNIQFAPQRVHVIGAGTMGGDIAAWCVVQGFTVTLQDLEERMIAPAIKRAYALFKERFKERHLIQQAMDRLIPDVTGQGLYRADVIIEAVVEDVVIKQSIFRQIESKAKPDAILATNTSSIPLDEINVVLKQPERLVGIHYFNPVAKMQLVEVVHGEKTSPDVVEKAIRFVRQLDRLPLPVKSSPGFLVNRILMPYLLESMVLLEEGVPMTAIDKAMTDFGMPMGPITLADTVGLDVCLSVANHLSNYFKVVIPERLIELVEKHHLGKKTGEGFYKYDKKGKQIKPETKSYEKSLTDISNRLVARMIDEAYQCLQEEVVADGDLLDAGMIFGTGFAPFRGGPIHYAQSQEAKMITAVSD